MNTLSMIITIVFLIFMLIGYKRGLFRSALKLVITGLSVLLSYFFAPLVSDIIVQNTKIDDYIQRRVSIAIEKNVRKNVEDSLKKEFNIVSDDKVDELTSLAIQSEPTKIQQIDIIDNLNVPKFVKNALLDNNHDQAKKEFGVSRFYDYLATYIARVIVNAIAFVVSFMLVMIVFGIISIVVSLAVKLPIVSSVNKLGGMLFGMLECVFIVWFIFILVAIFTDTAFGVWAYKEIEESSLLSFLYEKNIFMNVITDISKM